MQPLDPLMAHTTPEIIWHIFLLQGLEVLRSMDCSVPANMEPSSAEWFSLHEQRWKSLQTCGRIFVKTVRGERRSLEGKCGVLFA
jgi:hypothetical protein